MDDLKNAPVATADEEHLSDSAVYAGAADLIEAHGHLKHAYGSPTLGFCVGGAVRWMCQVEAWTPWTGYQRFAELVKRASLVTEARWGMHLTTWNDRTGCSQEEAVAFLREMSAEVIDGGK